MNEKIKMTINRNYQNLVNKLEEISHLNGVMCTLGWDQEVVMPPGASEARAQQIAALAGVIHERMTNTQLGECLFALQEENDCVFNVSQRCNIHEAQRDFDLETKIPKQLVMEMAALGSRAHISWVKAREDNKFSNFAPMLKQFLELKKEWAQCAFPNLSPYDANIDNFERGTTMAEITPIFDYMKTELIPLIQSIKEGSYHPDVSFLKGTFPVAKQESLGRRISQDIGFDFDCNSVS